MKKIKVLIVNKKNDTSCKLKASIQENQEFLVELIDAEYVNLLNIHTLKPDIILMDVNFENMYEILYASKVIRSQFNIPIMYLTEKTIKSFVNKSKLSTDIECLVKPYSFDELHENIQLQVG